jgi:hypothetical protein
MSKFVALFILLFLPFAFAAQMPLEKFLNASFEPGQNVTVSILSNPTFALVSSDGVETYLVNAETGNPIHETESMISILQADVKANSGFDAKAAAAASLSDNVSAAKQKAESQCMLLTGTDMHECTSIETCKVACLSNPNCAGSVYFADGFIEAMLDYTANRQKFSSDLVAYPQNIAAVSSDQSVLDQKVTLLNNMSFLAAKLSSNPIFLNSTDPGCTDPNSGLKCFEYCPKADYSISRIAAEISDLQSIRTIVATVQAQPSRVDAILAAGSNNDAYLANRGKNYQAFRLEMENSIAALNKRAIALGKNVSDSNLSAMLSSLSNFSLSINQQAAAGYYHAALAQRGAFEAQAAALSARMDADAAAYASFSSSLAAFSGKVDSSEGIIGPDSAQAYRLQIGQIRTSVSANGTLEQLGLSTQRLGNLSQNLTEEVAAAALARQGAPRAPPTPAENQSAPSPVPAPTPSSGKLPCLPGIILLSLIGFAFVRKS